MTVVAENWKGNGILFLSWADIQPDGVWTGDTCSVIATASGGGVTCFVQHLGARPLPDPSELITRQQAEQVAADHFRKMAPADAKVVASAEHLVLSHPVAPHHGPVWSVTVTIGAGAGAPVAKDVAFVDARTALVLPLPR
jgi:hypothetical protein